ncbi:MAG: MFS transporter [Jatrophihabitans sp.]|uniref:MFS transporter n=1 Tax=Jatrophihabitans sp. TaxID=1932789 RepID=UPI0039105DA5
MPRASYALAFAATAYAFVATMLGTTLPTPLYPTYQRQLDFGALTVTIVFATYAIGVLAALLAFGRASDTLGRRPVLLAGLAAALLSSVVFLAAAPVHAHSGGLALLLVGRFLSGLSAGVFTGTATATLADFAGEHTTRATVVAAVANIGGLGLGPLVAGALARSEPHPLVTPYAVHVVLIGVALIAVLRMPEPVDVQRPRRLAVQRLGVPASLRTIFLSAGTAGFAGFAVLGFFTAVTPATLGLLGHHNPLLTGVVVFVVFAASAVGQLVSIRFRARPALLGGTCLLVVGTAVIGLGIGTRSLPILVAGGLVAGLGQGCSFRSALGAIVGASPGEQRAAVSSSFFAVCYVGISLPVVGIGASSDAIGLQKTAVSFAVAIAVLGAIALISLVRTSRSTAARS